MYKHNHPKKFRLSCSVCIFSSILSTAMKWERLICICWEGMCLVPSDISLQWNQTLKTLQKKIKSVSVRSVNKRQYKQAPKLQRTCSIDTTYQLLICRIFVVYIFWHLTIGQLSLKMLLSAASVPVKKLDGKKRRVAKHAPCFTFLTNKFSEFEWSIK